MTETNKSSKNNLHPQKGITMHTMLEQPPTDDQMIILNSLGVKPLSTKGDCAVLINYFNHAKIGTANNVYYNNRVQTFIANQQKFIGKKIKLKKDHRALGIVDYIFIHSFSMSTLFAYILKPNGVRRYKIKDLMLIE